MKTKYRVGDMFLVHHGNDFSRGILCEIRSCEIKTNEYMICWFHRTDLKSPRQVGYSEFEVKTHLDRCSWYHHPVGK